jgi:chromosome segregation ATPase
MGSARRIDLGATGEMAKTFHQIKEANTEIQRLSTELSTAQESLNGSQAEALRLQNDHKAALEKKDNEHKAAIDAKDAKIKELEGNVTKITGERDGARTEITTKDARIKELEGKNEAAAASATTVEKRASEIAASVGSAKPIAAGKAETAKDDPRARLQEAWGRQFIKG